MAPSDTASPQNDAHAEAARARLVDAVSADPALDGARIDDLLRLVPGKRALFAGSLGGVPVIFRLYFEKDGARQAANQWAEMQRANAYLDGGPYRINVPLYLNEKQGLLVVEKVRGKPLMNHMRRQDDAECARLSGEAVRWLRAYTEPTETTDEARVSNWLARADEASARQPHATLRDLDSQVLAEMTRLAGRIGGTVWRKAICHGDFHPNNLLLASGDLVGIDIGGSDMIPIYKDMARFLVHLARRGVLPSGRRRFGVDGAVFEEFAVVFGLNPAEMELFLPFMIGFEILFRPEARTLEPRRLRQAADIRRGWLADVAD